MSLPIQAHSPGEGLKILKRMMNRFSESTGFSSQVLAVRPHRRIARLPYQPRRPLRVVFQTPS